MLNREHTMSHTTKGIESWPSKSRSHRRGLAHRRILAAIAGAVAGLGGLGLLGTPAAQADATLTDLGLFPGNTFSIGTAVSRDGATVIGFSGPYDDQYSQGYFWHGAAGPMLSIGVLADGSVGSFASAVSGNGSVIVGSSGTQDFRHAVRWTSAEGIQLIPGLSTDFDSDAEGVSSSGLIVVGNQLQTNRAFIWSAAGGLQDLPVTPLTTSTWASAISGDGSTVIGWMGDSVVAFRWTSAGGTQILAGGAQYTYANGVSDDGSVIVGEYLNPSNTAFRWTQAGGIQPINPIPGYENTSAKCVSGDGRVVGVNLGSFLSNDTAGIWTAETGLVELGGFLTSKGVDVSGWTFQQVSGISYDGQVITGYGHGPGDADTHAWIVRGLHFSCRADFNGDGLAVDDIFDFLNAWFAGDPRTDFNGVDGVTVQDIFDFLNAWFVGC
jgi:uncharacterized membrane protein